MIKYPHECDKSIFSKDRVNLEVKYGLPSNVVYCNRCVISNQRPNSTNEFTNNAEKSKKTIHFDQQGVCDACLFAEIKNQKINWSDREKELAELCDRYRKKDGSYDCLVPGSGGKDSFYAAHILKYKYGMHPLTITWAPHIYTDWGRRNHTSWIQAGFDNFLITPDGMTHRLLTRLAVENLLHPFQPFMLGQKGLAPKIADKFNIPLVFYGENEVEYGNPRQEGDSATRDKKYFSTSFDELFFGGVSVKELLENYGLTRSDLSQYLPINPEVFEKSKIDIHYLGYYLKWHPQSCYYYAVEQGGFEASPERTEGTYSKYNSIDDKIDDLHYYTTGVKFGLGRASYDAAQEIRSGDITRDEGIALVKRYDHEYPQRFMKENLEYLSLPEKQFPIASKQFEQPIIDEKYFELLCDSFRSPHLWTWHEGSWRLRKPVCQKDASIISSVSREYETV